jgi:hypothetical protein
MRFRLRTLLILLALLPPVLAPFILRGWRAYVASRNQARVIALPREKGYLGGEFEDAPDGPGVFVFAVRPGSAAEASGLKERDVITVLNDQPCHNVDELFAVLDKSSVGTTLTMSVIRDGGDATVRSTLRKQPLTPWIASPAQRKAAADWAKERNVWRRKSPTEPN